jgi:hypothetical protein
MPSDLACAARSVRVSARRPGPLSVGTPVREVGEVMAGGRDLGLVAAPAHTPVVLSEQRLGCALLVVDLGDRLLGCHLGGVGLPDLTATSPAWHRPRLDFADDCSGTLPVMTSKLRPVVRHPVATIGWVAAAGWTWRNRHRLASFRSLAVSAPGRMRRGEHRDVATELRARAFLVRDRTGRQIHDARLLEVVEGEAVIDGDPTSPDYAALARLLAGRPGITGLRQHVAGDHAEPVEV